MLSNEEFNQQALLKARQLAIAANNVLNGYTSDLGFHLDGLKKVLTDYDNFIIDRVNKKV